MVRRKLFVPAVPPVQPGRSVNRDLRPPRAGQETAAARSSYFGDNNMADPNLAGRLKDAAVNKAKGAAMGYVAGKIGDEGANLVGDLLNAGISAISGDGRDATMPTFNQGSGGGTTLSVAPNPKETHLKTGIALTILEKPMQDATENVCSPMHINTLYYNLPIASSSTVKEFFDKVVVYNAQTSAQDNVNWAIDIVNKFSGPQILSAMNALFYALQIYFFYRSVDTYSRSRSEAVNFGLKTIREQFDYDTQNKMDILRRMLLRTPIPPNMLEFSRYLHSNYMSGDTPGASVIKVCPHAPVSVTQLVDNTKIDYAISGLQDASNMNVFMTLFRSVKNWVLFDEKKLYDPPVELLYDKDFITIFNNMPFRTNIAGNLYHPVVATLATNYNYNSYTNTLDGAAVALTDAYVTSTSAYGLGLANLPVFGGESRFSYYKVGSVTGWYSPSAYSFLRSSRQDTYESNATTVTSKHTFGSDMVENISPNMQKVAGTRFISWLMSNSTIVKPKTMSREPRQPRRGK